MPGFATVFLGFLCAAAADLARDGQGPAAVVADISGEAVLRGRKPPLDFADELRPGQMIRVAEGAVLVLIYYRGCRQETLRGPVELTVSPHGSEAEPGRVSALKVPCDSSARLAEPAGSAPAALVLRGGGPGVSAPSVREVLLAWVQSAPDEAAPRLMYASYLERQLDFAAASVEYDRIAKLKPGGRALDRRRRSLAAARELLRIEEAVAGSDSLAPGSLSPELAELVAARSAGRLALRQARMAGKVGESKDGRLAAMAGARLSAGEERAVVKENSSRWSMLKLIAREQGGADADEEFLERLKASAALIRGSLVSAGEWREEADGAWRRQ